MSGYVKKAIRSHVLACMHTRTHAAMLACMHTRTLSQVVHVLIFVCICFHGVYAAHSMFNVLIQPEVEAAVSEGIAHAGRNGVAADLS